jgi:hypothetical protein
VVARQLLQAFAQCLYPMLLLHEMFLHAVTICFCFVLLLNAGAPCYFSSASPTNWLSVILFSAFAPYFYSKHLLHAVAQF